MRSYAFSRLLLVSIALTGLCLSSQGELLEADVLATCTSSSVAVDTREEHDAYAALGGEGVEVVGDIDYTGDMTWTADKTWIVTGVVLVKGGTLTIEPGTKVLLGVGSGIRQDGGTVVSTDVAFEQLSAEKVLAFATAPGTEVDTREEHDAYAALGGEGVEVVGDVDYLDDVTWTADKTWIVTGVVLVKGGTLTIEPGAKVLLGVGSGVRQVGGTVVSTGVAFASMGDMDVHAVATGKTVIDTRTDDTHYVSAGTTVELYGEDPWTAPNEADLYTLSHTDEFGKWFARYCVVGSSVVVVSDDDITSDVTWTSNRTWIVAGTVLVKGGTLTIEPGTKVVLGIGGGIRQVGGEVVSDGVAFSNINFDGRMDYAEAEKGEVRLDMDVGGLRVAAKEEPLTFSSLWGESAAAQVKLSYATAYGEKADVVNEAGPAEGEYLWQANMPGYYTFTHVAGDETLSATFVVADSETTETVFEGDIAESTDWAKEKVILIDGIVTVKSGVTLTIEPGAVVKFMDGAGIVCEAGGRCVADGVIFTHVNDDTVGGDTLLDGSTSPLSDMYVLDGVSGNDATQYRYHPDPTVTLSGTIAKNEVWRGFNIYHVTGNITVPNGVTLTIEPGAIIKFDTGLSLTVNSGATLNAIGTRAQPIVFTSIKDDEYGGDTNGDGNKTMPYLGDWTKICVNGGTANFDYTHILYSSRNETTGAINMPNGGKVVFNNGEIAHCAYDAVGVESGNFYMTNSVIRDCLLAFRHWARDPIVNCIIYDCGRLTQGGGQNFVNCIFSHITETWEAFGFPRNTTYRNCCFWNEGGSVLTGEGTQDAMTVCGKDGNIWGDPLFLAPDSGDFRLAETSPCVDAGLASVAPATDYFGQPRVNAPDIGICEVMPRNVTSDIDLVPQSVTADAEAVSGQMLTVNWTVSNQGGADLDAEWRDTISLFSENGRAVTLGDKVITKRLVAGGTVSCSASFIVPAIAEGAWYPKVNVNSYRDVFEGAQGENNALTGDAAINVSTTTLDLSIANNGIINANSPTVLKLAFDATNDNRMVKLDVPAGVTVTWGFGFMPTAGRTGVSPVQSGSTNGTGVSPVQFRVPDDANEVYVVLESDTTATYNLSTETTKMVITSVTPATLPSSGTTTLTITGAGFGETNALSLISPVGRVALSAPQKDASGNLIATVDCATLTAGQTYDLAITSGDNSAAFPGAVTVMKVEGKGVLEARLIVSDSARQHRMSVGYVEYENVGNGDMPAPIFIVSSRSRSANDMVFSLVPNSDLMNPILRIVGVGAVYPKGVLRHGDKCRIPFYYRVVGNSYNITLSVVDENSGLLRESAYPTWKDFCVGMSEATTRMNGMDGNTSDYDVIYANAMRKAYGQCVGVVRGRLIDIVSSAPLVGEQLYIADTNLTVWATATTDENGEFRFDDLQDGIAYRIGSYTCQADSDEIVCAEGSVVNETLYGAPFAEIKITVDGLTQSLMNDRDTCVALYDRDAKETFYCSIKDGCFTVTGLVDGVYSVLGTTTGMYCLPSTPDIVIEGGRVTNSVVQIGFLPAGRVIISAVDEKSGVPISSLAYRLVDEEGNIFTSTFDVNGKSTIKLPAGKYVFVQAQEVEYDNTKPIDVVAGVQTEISVGVKRSPFSVIPSMGVCNLTSVFAVSADATNGIDNVEWDFDNDGEFDAYGLVATNVYVEAGEFDVRMRLTYTDGSIREYLRPKAVETWAGSEFTLADGTIILNDDSGYTLISQEDNCLTLELNWQSLPLALDVGTTVVLPNDLLRPLRIVSIEGIDKTTARIYVEGTRLESAYQMLHTSIPSSSVRLLKTNLRDINYSGSGTLFSFSYDSDGDSDSKAKKFKQESNGGVEISANINGDLCIVIADGKLEKVSWAWGGEASLRLYGSLSVTGRSNKMHRRSYAKSKFEKTIWNQNVVIGVVPVNFNVVAYAEAKLEGSLSWKTSFNYEYRWTRSDGFREPATSPAVQDFYPQVTGTASASVGIKCSGAIGAAAAIGKSEWGAKLLEAGLSIGYGAELSITRNTDPEKEDEVSFSMGPKIKGSVELVKASFGPFWSGSLASWEAELKLDGLVSINGEWKTPKPTFALDISDWDKATYNVVVTGTSTTMYNKENTSLRSWDWYWDGATSSSGNSATYKVKPKDRVHHYAILSEQYDYVVPRDWLKWLENFNGIFGKKQGRCKFTLIGGGTEDDEPVLEQDKMEGNIPRSYDPNEMRGKLGLGDPETQRFVKPGEELTYTIYFENKTNATAAAQEVYVTNPLSEWLDWSTFKMHEVAFGDQVDLGLADKSSGTSEVTMKGTNFVVRTELVLEENGDAGTRDACPYQAKWYMRIVDPTTDTGWPTDIVAGFLPPNDETHRGEGHITYSICVRADAPANLVISNSADIVFDHNPSIKTDPAWWNTVAPTTGNAKFNEAIVETEESSNAVIRVTGGNLYTASSVKVYLTYNTAAAADLDLAKGEIDGVAPKGGLKFPLLLTWEKGEMGEKVITIPVKTDKTVEDDEFFTLQLAEAEGMELGEEWVCTVTIRDATVAAGKETLQDAVNNAVVKMSTSGKGKWAYANVGTGDESEPGKTASASAVSPVLKAGEASELKAAAVKGSGTLSFDVRVANPNLEGESPEAPEGAAKTVLTLFDGKVALLAWTNETDWTSASYTVEEEKATSHAFTWQVVQGADPEARAYVANVVWSPAGTDMRAVTLAGEPVEGGTVAGSGVYPDKTKISLVATANVGYEFIGWYDGETLFDAKAKPSVTLTNDLALTARFEKIPYVRGLADPADGGKVSGSGLCARGKKVTLKAAANKNFTFLGWAKTVNSEEGIVNSFVATTPTLVIDRTAKPAASSKTSTTITNIAEDVTYFAVFKSDPEIFVTVDATDGTGAEPTGKGAGKYVAGTITGMGKYAPGKTKIALKAAANKGYVFAGWLDANGELLAKDATYTIAAMGESDVEYTAKFVTADEDKASIELAVAMGAEAEAFGLSTNEIVSVTNFCGVAMNWPVTSGGLSETKVKVSGLPAGLKFTDKPVTSKIGSGKSAVTVTNVPANTIYGAPTAASKTDKNGNVTSSKVVFTVTTAGKSTQTFAINLYIDPLPAWAVGTFDGAVYAGDSVEASGIVQAFTVAANGKISGKLLRADGTWALSADSFASYDAKNDAYLATVVGKNGKLLETNEVTVAASGVTGATLSEASVAWKAYQNLWKRADTKTDMPVIKKNIDKVLGNGLKLTFKKDGVVSFAGKLDGTSVSGSSQLVSNGEKWQVTLYAPAKGTFKGYSETLAVTLTLGEQNVVTAIYVVGGFGKVQLWEGGPYWATTNIGAEKPEDCGYYFWWGDTVGYKRENNHWVAIDGSSFNFAFEYENTPTWNKSVTTLQREGWITADGVLAPEHDAAQVQWGGGWRMPTDEELYDLCYVKCIWTWTTMNDVKGYVVCGRGNYASNSIFLPAAGAGHETSLHDDGLFGSGAFGFYWSSVPYEDGYNSWYLEYIATNYIPRCEGLSIRPVQSPAE